jgi:hypothetical protein
MTGFLLAALGVFAALGMTALGDMVSAEVRDRLDHLPHAILHLAARRLDSEQRVTMYDDEWMPELTFILKGDDARPITRLYHGTRFALGILVSARRIASQVHRKVLVARHPRFAQIAVLSHPDGSLTLQGMGGLGVGDTIKMGAVAYDVLGRVNEQEWAIRKLDADVYERMINSLGSGGERNAGA